MSVTLEQVEKLREKTGASYSDCQEALELSGGDMLEALVRLERLGKSRTAAAGGFYTTRPGGAPHGAWEAPPEAGAEPGPSASAAPGRAPAVRRSPGEFFRWLFHVVMINRLELWRHDRLVGGIPVLIAILLVILIPWILLPLFAVSLFLGCRYRFSGPDLGREAVNDVMDGISGAAEDLAERLRSSAKQKKRK